MIGLVPELLIGGLLLYIGLEFLYEWLYRPAQNFNLGDLAIVVIILTIVSLVGLIQGIIVGIVTAIVIFAVKYSGLNVLKLDTTIAEFRSTVQRTEQELALLEREGHRAQILQLRDFVFFGSANKLLMRIRDRMTDHEVGGRYLVMDFRFVTGIDVSAIISCAVRPTSAKRQHHHHPYSGAASGLRPDGKGRVIRKKRGGLEAASEPRSRGRMVRRPAARERRQAA